jgi:hypothetical protein
VRLSSILMLCGALSFSGLLLSHRGNPAPLETHAVYVYYTSTCPNAGNGTGCQVNPGQRPSFATMAGCIAHADQELKMISDQHVMASCEKMREI